MITETQIIQFAQPYHALLLSLSPENDGLFKAIATVHDAGTDKPLLLVGNAHSQVQDGECIAILNPSKDLMKEVKPGVAYTPGVLKEIVAGRCEQMFHLWFDHYKKGAKQVSVLASYKKKGIRPVEVTARDV